MRPIHSANRARRARSFLWLRMGLLLALMGMGRTIGALEVTVVTADGQESVGLIKEVDAAQGLSISGRWVALKDIAEVHFPDAKGEATKEKVKVILRNDDFLFGEIKAGTDEALKVVANYLGEIQLGNDLLKGLTFPVKAPPPEAVLRAFFSGQDPAKDLFLSPKGETVEGFMGSFSDKELIFDAGGQKQTIPYDKLCAFRYAALEAFKPAQGVLARLQLGDGAVLSGALKGYADGKFDLANAKGTVWKIPEDAIRILQVQGGRLVYLSDLEPRVEQKPYVGGAPVVLGLRKDASTIGEQIRIGKKAYLRGLGVHSYCSVTYDLGGQYDRILTDVGMDVSAGAQAVCSWKVRADGKELAGGESKAGESPKRLSLSVVGAKSLVLICDYGSDEDDAGDHFDWADARLLRK